MSESSELDSNLPETKDSLLLGNINEAARVAYSEQGRKLGIPPEDVYFSRFCESVSELMAKNLSEKDVKTVLLNYKGWDITDHQFLKVHQEEDALYVDPTWQQFLGKPDPKLPKVFISPENLVVKKLGILGIPKEKHHIWTTATTPGIQK